MFPGYPDAIPLDHSNAPGLVACVEELAGKAGTRTPKLLLLPSDDLNAFYHFSSGSLGVTEGILHAMKSKNMHAAPSRELRAVLAHEMGHVKFRYLHTAPQILLLGGLPIVGAGAMYLVDKTNEKLREFNELHPGQHKDFWKTFDEVTHELRADGVVKAFKDYYSYNGNNNFITLENHSLPWSKVVMKQAREVAVMGACMIPALAACKPLSIKNEFQSDRFAVALTGNTDDFLSALDILSKDSERAIKYCARTPLQKNWAERIISSLKDFIESSMSAHPEFAERIKVIKGLNPEEVARSFHI